MFVAEASYRSFFYFCGVPLVSGENRIHHQSNNSAGDR